MEFKVQSLTEVWRDIKLYVIGLLAMVGIIVGSVFSYQAVVKPIANSFTVGQVKADGDKDDKVDLSYSFYDMSAWLSAYYNAASSPSGWRTIKADKLDKYSYHSLLTKAAIDGANAQDSSKEGTWTYADLTWVNPNNHNIGGGGALLGFPDSQIIKGGILGFFASKTSSSTVDYSYDSLNPNGGIAYNSLETYAFYGAALDNLGIDASIGSGLSGFHPIRLAGGAVIWLGYILASSAELLFKVVISILQFTNPFDWFAKGFSYTWSNIDPKGSLSGLVDLVSGLYKTFSNFGWVIVLPATVASVIFLFIFTGNGKQNQGLNKSRVNKLKYLVIYFLFLSVGVPVLGTSYTAGLNALSESFNKDNVGNGSSSIDRLIYMTYVDNKNWIEGTRMYLPKSVSLSWNTARGDVSNTDKAHVRKYALAINRLANPSTVGNIPSVDDKNDDDWNIRRDNNGKAHTNEGVNTLLLRYMNSSIYPASNWETLVKARLAASIENGGNQELVDRITSSATELTSKEGYKYIAYVDPHTNDSNSGGIEVTSFENWWKLKTYKFGSKPNIFVSKGFVDNGLGGIISTTTKQSAGELGSVARLESNPNADPAAGLVYGSGKATMSYLEMFNYLNSKFTSNKVQVYSTNALASNVSRDSHAEVNQVGSGYVHKFMIWLNTAVLLFGIAFLAIGYAASMLISSFKRYVNLIMSIFMGAMGMQKAMVKAASGTIMLVYEIVTTLVVYEIIKTIYIEIPDILSTAVAGLNGGSKVTSSILAQVGLPVAVADLGGFVLVIFSLMLSVIILVWALLMFLRIRKPIIEMADSTFTNLISKLFYGDADLAKGEDGKGGSTGMNSDVESVDAGESAGSIVSNVDGADGNDNDSFIDGSKEVNKDEEDNSVSKSNEDNSNEEEKPSSDSVEANSKETEKIGEGVKEKGSLDRSEGGKSGSEAHSDSPSEISEGESKGLSGVGRDSTGKRNSDVKASKEIPTSSEANKGVTSISDDDTVNVSASEESPKSELSSDKNEGSSSFGSLSPQITGEKGVDKGNKFKTDSKEALSKQGEVEASKELASHSNKEDKSKVNSKNGSQKRENSNRNLEKNGNLQSSVEAVQSGHQSSDKEAQSSQSDRQNQQSDKQGNISAAESGRKETTTSRSQKHRQQAKVDAISARDNISRASSDAVSAVKDVTSGTKNVASGLSSVASGVGAMVSGEAGGKEMVSQGVEQVATGAKQLGSSVVNTAKSVKNATAGAVQGVSAVANVGASVGTAIADSKAGQVAGTVVGTVANTAINAAGVGSIPRTVNGSTPSSANNGVTSTVVTTTTSNGDSGSTTTTTVVSQAQSNSGQGQVRSMGGVLGAIGNHIENEVVQSVADVMGSGATVVRHEQANSNGGAQTIITSSTTTSSGSGHQNVNVTSSGNGGPHERTVNVNTNTPSSGSGHQNVNVTSSGNGGYGINERNDKVVTTTTSLLNRVGNSGPRNVPYSGGILKQTGVHIENELNQVLNEMGGSTPTSSANSEEVVSNVLEKMKRENLQKVRKNRFNRPK